MTAPHKHAAVIKAWADGAIIEYRDRDGGWNLTTDPQWEHGTVYRVKPANVVRFLPVMTRPGSSGVIIGVSTSSSQCAVDQANHSVYLTKRVLRVEINPDTLDLVSATMETS